MVFSSITFLYYFLPLVIVLYFPFRRVFGNGILFLFSLLFYAWGEPVYVFLMLFSTFFNYLAGIFIGKSKGKRMKRAVLAGTITLNFLILFYFKYFGFAVGIINSLFRVSLEIRELSLPVGISFYTFQAVSYIVDVYRKDAQPQKNFINFGCYIALFPQLIAGPIVRYNRIEEQLVSRKMTAENFTSGVSRFVSGLAKKVLIANNVGALWDSISSMPLNEISLFASWLGIIAFTMQIYFDFSGYSDMAIGLGKMFGFDFDENFNYPYISKSVSEFWRRWHISLGTWFKEYVYIPLGGSRKGKLRTVFNLLVVWMFTGLWHGASYNFVVWGLYYALLLVVEKLFLLKLLEKCPSFVRYVYTMLSVIFGWVLFASPDLSFAFSYINSMFTITKAGICDNTFLYMATSYAFVIAVAVVGCVPLPKKIYNKCMKNNFFGALMPLVIAIIFMMCTAYLVDSGFNPFLYFRF